MLLPVSGSGLEKIMDPVCPEGLDPDPVNIRPTPTLLDPFLNLYSPQLPLISEPPQLPLISVPPQLPLISVPHLCHLGT